MNKESEERFVPTLLISFGVSWLLVWVMTANGHAHWDNMAFSLISIIRWILTAAVVVWLLFTYVPAYFEASEAEEKRRKDEREQNIEREVTRRVRAIRQEEWKAQEAERQREKLRKEEEDRRKTLEDQWRKEHEEKLKLEIRQARTASEASEQAFNDFI